MHKLQNIRKTPHIAQSLTSQKIAKQENTDIVKSLNHFFSFLSQVVYGMFLITVYNSVVRFY